MVVKNVSLHDLQDAIVSVNKLYNGNIAFKATSDISTSRTKKFRFTLRVLSSFNPGACRNPITGRHSPSACWHVHGDFFAALLSVNPSAVIITSLHGKHIITKDGGNWQDYQQGPNAFPYNASDACECNGKW